MALYPIEAGDVVGTYRVTGGYPHDGYRAVDVGDGTRVHLEVSLAVDWRERAIQLLRAASIVGSLEHPGVARIHGRGVLADRRPWVASELADGVPLSEVLLRRSLTVPETVSLVRDLCEIAAHAHSRGLLHGAIRPHLVVLRTGEQAFPLQLGGWGGVQLARGVDGRVDVYAIGAIAYRGLVGRYPGLLTPALWAGVPGPLGGLLARMLAIDPAQRMTALEALGAATQLVGDRVRSGPRFSRPRWTPAPQPDGERVADIIDLAAARRERS